ncbi:MAG: transposase family protein [Chloroflexi bacterium]|nr:transposase family protein [Chloroflexota bacterium]
MIVIAFGLDVQAYVENEGHQQCPRPTQCPHCGAVGRMTGHGSYGRKPKDLERAYQIRVKRWQCQHCQQTTSCLPSFLLSWRHYLVAVIQAVLVQRLEQGGSWSAIVRQCSLGLFQSKKWRTRWN